GSRVLTRLEKRFPSVFAKVVVAVIAAVLSGGIPGSLRLQSQPLQRRPSRITQRIDDKSVVRVLNSTHGAIRRAFDRGRIATNPPMNRAILALKSSPEQEKALEQLLADQQDPSSPRYHQWLTPQEFGARFGATSEEIGTVTGWLQSHGFTVNSV